MKINKTNFLAFGFLLSLSLVVVNTIYISFSKLDLLNLNTRVAYALQQTSLFIYFVTSFLVYFICERKKRKTIKWVIISGCLVAGLFVIGFFPKLSDLFLLGSACVFIWMILWLDRI